MRKGGTTNKDLGREGLIMAKGRATPSTREEQIHGERRENPKGKKVEGMPISST